MIFLLFIYSEANSHNAGGGIKTMRVKKYFFFILLLGLAGILSASTTLSSNVLFHDDFEDGVADGWSLEPGWQVEQEDGNYVLRGEGHYWARLRIGGNWTDYAFKFRLKLLEGTIHLNYRMSEAGHFRRYFIGFHDQGLYLQKQIDNRFTELREILVPHKLNVWHEVEIRGYQAHLQVLVDGTLELDYVDEDPLLRGTIAFETLEGGKVFIDDIEIRVIGEEDLVSKPTTSVVSGRVGGSLLWDQVWRGEVLVESTVIVPQGVTLTIAPGTKVRFRHYRGYKEPERKPGLIVLGTLRAVGTPKEPIWFTSDADDPINGDWRMIRFENASDESIIQYTIVEFAQQGINVWHSNPTLSHLIVRWNNWEGIYLESYCHATIDHCRIYQNGYNGIAMEQFNEVIVQDSYIAENGTHGIHVDASQATVERCILEENRAAGLSVDDHGTLVVHASRIRNNGSGIQCGEGKNIVELDRTTQISSNQGPAISCPAEAVRYVPATEEAPEEIEFDFPDLRPYELGYIPGDPDKDRYMYIYPSEDETRRVVNRIGKGLGLTWSVTWDGSTIWTATLWGDVYQLDPKDGKVLRHWRYPGPQAWGMTWDGQSLWINDFAEKRVYQLSPWGHVLSWFKIPDPKGGAKGITWDGKALCIMGWTSPTIYRVDREGHLLNTIELPEGGGGIAWDGENFWVPGGPGIMKVNYRGEILGYIYAASEGTWDLTWDGHYLWATQRTNENWQDPKIYQIEIINLIPYGIPYGSHGSSSGSYGSDQWNTHLGLGCPEPFEGSRWPMEEKMDIAASTGIKILRAHRPTTRDWFSWQAVEPIKGHYDFTATDELVKMAQERGLVLLPQVFPYVDWDQRSIPGSKGHSKPHDMEAYKAFLNTLVERYDGDGVNDMPELIYPLKYWEILNEPSAGFFDGSPQEYVKILKESYRAVKAACPACLVLNGGIINNPLGIDYFSRTLDILASDSYCKAHNLCFDILSVHSGDGLENVWELNRSLAARGISRKIWVTEFDLSGATIQEMAGLFVKNYIRAMASGIVDKVMWFAVTPDNPFSSNYNRHALINEDGSERPIFSALKVMASKLNTFGRVERIAEGQYRFTKDKQIIYVLWGKNPPPELPEKVRVTYLDGREIIIKAEDLRLTDDPILVEPLAG